jgi:hypothetical protein
LKQLLSTSFAVLLKQLLSSRLAAPGMLAYYPIFFVVLSPPLIPRPHHLFVLIVLSPHQNTHQLEKV